MDSKSGETLTLRKMNKEKITRPLALGLLRLRNRFLVFVLLLGILLVLLVWDLWVVVVGNWNSGKRFSIFAID